MKYEVECFPDGFKCRLYLESEELMKWLDYDLDKFKKLLTEKQYNKYAEGDNCFRVSKKVFNTILNGTQK